MSNFVKLGNEVYELRNWKPSIADTAKSSSSATVSGAATSSRISTDKTGVSRDK